MSGISVKLVSEETGMDHTEAFRRQRLSELNPGRDRMALERRYGTVLDTDELVAAFAVIGVLAPFVVVRRKVDGKVGSLEFQHEPRFYFNWMEAHDG